ncbi:ABC transporter substrate-binding protein [Plectonema radiosum NIES-515]|uniref:ABC transporter substrate-binding protein n=1 Tax=Plectonema radiosum NIES-515 TaxID=2986073 RepID=A0ABT3AZJ4_9CYAN|nr:ABC transporter substrate-binding protein [Plectonema radiosum]MCV3214405.1 ABC transporter substrate-binding protein [Plectonema radiosum NIES-515]
MALLIGVSEYEPGLTSLPAATKDVKAMEGVLQHPEIGGFDEIKVLENPQRQVMEEAIETLFDGRQKDDLVLLFFSGHGIKDESGKLYFATHNTRKNSQARLVETTAVAASSVHKFMTTSRSRHQVVILDCCFSGAFAEGLSAKDDKDNGFVDIKNQLGGEGRAVLTSSTSTQYSFEQQGADTSTYTRYIVEGLETGAADRDEDGWISVDELHEYAAKKVQEAAPAMKPEIYPIKGGYKIKLAKAPSNDPKLTYLREVEYWVEGGNGEISFTGRAVLDALQEKLKLASEEAAAIETKVLAPIEVYKRKLQRYEQAFRKEIEDGFPLSDRTRANLKRLQQALGLRDEDIALIEAPIIAEQPPTTPTLPPSTPPRPRNSNFLHMGASCIIGVVIGATGIYALLHGGKFQPTPTSCAYKEPYILNDSISLGEEILLKQDTNPNKEAGVKAFAKGDCQTAIDKFNSYRKTNSRDPEALIYLNNAKARQKGNWLKIAVSVPIGTNQNVAEQILRGVAQAQDEVNNNRGINGKQLEVAIANDDNDPTKAVQRATQFVTDTSILAVLGHNSSNASLSAAPVYQTGRLVMMSPTSFAQNLTSVGNYIFRTAPSVKSIADSVSNYAVKKAGKTNFLICVDYQGIDNQSFNNEFIRAIKTAGGQINSTDCDISARDFNPSAVISQAVRSGANGLVLGLYIDKIKQGLAVVQSNQGQLTVFGSPTLFTDETLKQGRGINGLIISAPWYPGAFPNNIFPQKAQKLWGATVSWRTATTYDATLAIVAGLQQTNRRDELQKVLHSQTFSVDGATGKIEFLPSGDRINNSIFLVKVQQKPGNEEYEFVPIRP